MGNAPKRVSRAYVGFGGTWEILPRRCVRLPPTSNAGAGHLAAASPVYRSDPVGLTDQPPFLNAVAAIDTELDPGALLDVLLAVEAEHGRVRDVRWGRGRSTSTWSRSTTWCATTRA